MTDENEALEYTEEVLSDLRKDAQPYGAGFTDSPEMVSEDLAREIYRKAVAYRIEIDIATEAGDQNIVEFPAQAGLLRSEQLVPSPVRGEGVAVTSRYKVYPVTAKHNMSAELGRALHNIKLFTPSVRSNQIIEFADKGLQALEIPLARTNTNGLEVSLPYGFDFTFGSCIDQPNNAFTSKVLSFEVVRHDFHVEKDQKIGICVWRNSSTRITQLPEAEEVKYYGKPNKPVIQTGIVTTVFGNGEVFGHSINTYKGCSGAVVFLLDKDQPTESVRPEDYGKAIGVHAGGFDSGNLGMAIFDSFNRMTNEALAALD
jgi:hypothetical protein